jgi:hypothetical protein
MKIWKMYKGIRKRENLQAIKLAQTRCQNLSMVSIGLHVLKQSNRNPIPCENITRFYSSYKWCIYPPFTLLKTQYPQLGKSKSEIYKTFIYKKIMYKH